MRLLVLGTFVLIQIIFVCSFSVKWSEWEDYEIAKQKYWVPCDDSSEDEVVEILFGLHLRNTDQFTSELLDVSDPTSHNYGIHNIFFTILLLTNI